MNAPLVSLSVVTGAKGWPSGPKEVPFFGNLLGFRRDILGFYERWTRDYAILSFAPLTAVNKRLLFVAMGTLLLLALNKISVLGVQHFLEAPKV